MSTQLKEKQILQAAEELFTTRRFHEVTMDDVCQQAGVGKGTIYRYFKDKEELFQRIITSGMDELCETIRATAASNQPIEEQLRRVLADIRESMERRRPLHRLMHSEEVRKLAWTGDAHVQWIARRKAMTEAVAQIFQRGVGDGVIRADISPEILAVSFLGLMRASVWQNEADNGNGLNEQLTNLFLRGALLPARRNELNP